MHFLAQAESAFISALPEHAVSSTNPLNSAAIASDEMPIASMARTVSFFIEYLSFYFGPFCDRFLYYTNGVGGMFRPGRPDPEDQKYQAENRQAGSERPSGRP